MEVVLSVKLVILLPEGKDPRLGPGNISDGREIFRKEDRAEVAEEMG